VRGLYSNFFTPSPCEGGRRDGGFVLHFLIFLILDHAKIGLMKNPEYLSVWKKREKEKKEERSGHQKG